MGTRTITNAVVVSSPSIPANSTPIQLALFGEDGEPFAFGGSESPVAEFQADSEATTVAALKNDLNLLLTNLKSSGLMASS